MRTYLQSGNAVFDAADDDEPAQALATAIEVRIERDLGPRVGVLVLPGEAMADVAAANPFLGPPRTARRRCGRGHPARHVPVRL